MQVVDLPGIYSLTANSAEERIARDYTIRERPDVVAVIVDAAALERSLYLLAELLWLPAPAVVGLNLMDMAEQQGLQIEPHVLEAALGLPSCQWWRPGTRARASSWLLHRGWPAILRRSPHGAPRFVG